MAARFKTVAYTLTGVATPLSDIINSAGDTFVSSLTLRAAKTNVADVTWTDSSGGATGGYLEPREAASFDLSGKFIKTTDIKFNGTLNDVVYITVIS